MFHVKQTRCSSLGPSPNAIAVMFHVKQARRSSVDPSSNAIAAMFHVKPSPGLGSTTADM